jgi:hypothetical protein
MELLNRSSKKITIELDGAEVILLNNSLNEILNGMNAIDPDEFNARLGVTHSEAKNLLLEFQALLKK